ncbi:MAG: TIGR04282 family arsenosugar biosynthesis glycosyltransferase [Planctomycetota bacterium]|jgi:rSAM/selenodomain-associated transferase 1
MGPHNNSCILLFAKSPAGGQVKTRLAAEIGDDFTVELYKRFVEDLISLIANLDVHLELCFYPPHTRLDFSEWLGEQYCYTPQVGDDLGERLKSAFDGAFEEDFSKVVAIGSDSPDLPQDFLRQAFKKLEYGGYCLIGFSRTSFLPAAFDDIAWSTSAVCEQTVEVLKKHKLDIYLLPEWYDVDTRSDLEKLIARNKDTAFAESKTAALIRDIEAETTG